MPLHRVSKTRRKVPSTPSIRSMLKAHEQKGQRREKALRELVERGALDESFANYLRTGGGKLHDYGRMLPHYAKIHRLLLKFGSGLKGKRLLHLGSGTGLYTQFLQSLGVKATGIDGNPFSLSAGKRIGNRRQVRADMRDNLSFRSNSIDYIVSDHFLLSNYGAIQNHEIKILREAHRVLKPGGVLVIGEATRLGLMKFQQIRKELGFHVRKLPTARGEIVLQKPLKK